MPWGSRARSPRRFQRGRTVDANDAASLLWHGVDPELLKPPLNMLRLSVHLGGLPSVSSMTAACSLPLIQRLRRTGRDNADQALVELIDEVESYLPRQSADGGRSAADGHARAPHAIGPGPAVHVDRNDRCSTGRYGGEPRDRDIPSRRC